MSEVEDRRKVGAVERHIATIAQMIAVLLLGWIGITTYQSSVKIEVLSERLSNFVDKEQLIWANVTARVSNNETKLLRHGERLRSCEEHMIRDVPCDQKAPPD